MNFLDDNLPYFYHDLEDTSDRCNNSEISADNTHLNHLINLTVVHIVNHNNHLESYNGDDIYNSCEDFELTGKKFVQDDVDHQEQVGHI